MHIAKNQHNASVPNRLKKKNFKNSDDVVVDDNELVIIVTII